MKGFKYNNSYDPQVISTCPVVPKHHRTFGKPSVYEQVSAEVERESSNPGHGSKRAKSMITLRDKILVDFENKEIHVTNEYGMRFVYSESQ